MPTPILAPPVVKPPEDKFITFMLKDDPVTYSLLFDFNQVCDAEVISGCNLMQALSGGVHITAAQTRALLFASLRTAHPGVSIAEAGELLSREYPVVLNALSNVISDWRTAGLAEEADGKAEDDLTAYTPVAVQQAEEIKAQEAASA